MLAMDPSSRRENQEKDEELARPYMMLPEEALAFAQAEGLVLPQTATGSGVW